MTSGTGFLTKFTQLRVVLGMLRGTLAGSLSFALAVAGFVALPWIPARSKALLWGWLAGGLIYLYVVVTVERVDYYMLPLLPLFALVIGGVAGAFVTTVCAAARRAGSALRVAGNRPASRHSPRYSEAARRSQLTTITTSRPIEMQSFSIEGCPATR